MLKPIAGYGLMVGALVALPTSASAGPGDQIRAGDAVVSPTLDVATSYRTNVYRHEEAPTPGTAIVIRPGVQIELEGDSVKVEADAGYYLRKYTDPSLSNLDRYADMEFGGGMSLFPNGQFGLEIDEDFVIKSRSSESSSTDSALIVHTSNLSRVLAAYHPGGSLSVGLGGLFGYDDYDLPASLNAYLDPNYNSKTTYGPALDLKWRFFPRTAFVLDASWRAFDWDDNFVLASGDNVSGVEDVGDYLGIADGTTYQVMTGLRGRFTDRVVLHMLLGYGQANYDEASVLEAAAAAGIDGSSSDIDVSEGFGTDLTGFGQGLLATLQIGWALDDEEVFSLGYEKNFVDSYFTNFVHYHYGFMRYESMLGSKLAAEVEAGYRLEGFFGEVTRSDQVVRVSGQANYSLGRWLSLTAGARWDRRASLDGIATVEYDDVNVFAGFVAEY